VGVLAAIVVALNVLEAVLVRRRQHAKVGADSWRRVGIRRLRY
jgi:hypothetical protein